MMKFVVLALFIAVLHYAQADAPVDDKQVKELAYPYNYRQYGGSRYGYDNAYLRNTNAYGTYGTYGAYPSTNYGWDQQRLQLSGGIYRPQQYDDGYWNRGAYSGYGYDNNYRSYDQTARRYGNYPYNKVHG